MNTLLTKRKKYKRKANHFDWGTESKEALKNSFKDASSGIGTTLGVLGTGLGIAQQASSLSQIADTSGIENNIENQNNYTSYASSNDELMNEFSNFQNLKHVTYDDVRGTSAGDVVSGIGSSAISGASTGLSVGGPWGAVIGGAIGGIASGIGAIIGAKRAREKTEELNKEIDIANAVAQKNLVDKVSTVDAMNDRSLLMNYSANGGPLSKGIFSSPQYARYHQPQVLFADGGKLFNTHGGVFSNGVTHINSGNSHENNPLEGVQIGVDGNNVPNLVEEGEVIFEDYVFSDRLTVPKDVKKSMKLKNKKGLTFADAAKEISKESEERPNDPISAKGLEVVLGKLAKVQEDIRFEKQMKDPEFRQQAMAAIEQQALQEQQLANQQMQQQGIMQPQVSPEEQMLLEQQMGRIPFAYGGNLFKRGGYTHPYFPGRKFTTIKELQEAVKNVRLNIPQLQLDNEERFIGFKKPVYDNFITVDGKTIDLSSEAIANRNKEYREEAELRNRREPEKIIYSESDIRNPNNTNIIRSSEEERALNTYVYDNDWGSFGFYNPKTQIYDKGYLEWLNNLNQDQLNVILTRNQNNNTLERYYSANEGYHPTLNQVKQLGKDKVHSDWHRILFEEYEKYKKAGMIGDKLEGPKDLKVTIKNPMFSNSSDYLNKKPLKITPSKSSKSSKSLNNILRYMPAIGSGLMALQSAFNRPDYSRAQAIEDSYTPIQGVSFTPLGDYMEYKPIDINYMANQLAAQNAATRNNIINQANGNRAAAVAGLLAADYTGQTALGNAYIEADKENLARLQAAKTFNRETNQYNSTGFFNASKTNANIANMNREALMNAIISGAEMRENLDNAYSNALSNNMNNLFNNLGNIGQDNLYRDQEEMVRQFLPYINANGGKINRKKTKIKKGLTI